MVKKMKKKTVKKQKNRNSVSVPSSKGVAGVTPGTQIVNVYTKAPKSSSKSGISPPKPSMVSQTDLIIRHLMATNEDLKKSFEIQTDNYRQALDLFKKNQLKITERQPRRSSDEVTQDVINSATVKFAEKLNKRGVGLAAPFLNEGSIPEASLREDNPEMVRVGLVDEDVPHSKRRVKKGQNL